MPAGKPKGYKKTGGRQKGKKITLQERKVIDKSGAIDSNFTS